MSLLSACVPFLGICGIHVTAPLLLELECSLCPECDVSGAARTDHAGRKKHLDSCFPAGYPLRGVCSLSVKHLLLVPLAGRSSLLLVRKLCINDARIPADFTRIFFFRMLIAGNISHVVCRGGGGTRTKRVDGYFSGTS